MNIIEDELFAHPPGDGTEVSYDDVVDAFTEIEENTHLLKTDLNLLTILSPTKHQLDYTVYAEMGETNGVVYDAQKDCFVFQAKSKIVNGIPDTEDNPLFIDGGAFKEMDATDESVYLTGKTLFQKTLFTMVGSKSLGKGIFRDSILATKWQIDPDPMPVSFLYREDITGIKKIFAVFSKDKDEKDFLSIETVMDALKTASMQVASEHGKKRRTNEIKVVDYSIRQEKRSIYVEIDSVQDDLFLCQPGIIISWSDTGFLKPHIENVWRLPDADVSSYIVQDSMDCGDTIEAITKKIRDVIEVQARVRAVMMLTNFKFENINDVETFLNFSEIKEGKRLMNAYIKSIASTLEDSESLTGEEALKSVLEKTKDETFRDAAPATKEKLRYYFGNPFRVIA